MNDDYQSIKRAERFYREPPDVGVTELPVDKPSLSMRRECIRAAIERIMDARERWKEMEADAESSSHQRAKAKERFDFVMEEFRFQWENVAGVFFSKPDLGLCDHEKREPTERYCNEPTCRNFIPF